jgi:predicted CxxxxCH...CXXCH cytochrome family protein
MSGYLRSQLIHVGAILIIGLVAFGCKSTIINQTDDKLQVAAYHRSGWNVRDSADFHGLYVKANGFTECSACHGITTYGGSSGISCLNCHSLTILGCTGCHGGKDNATGAPPYGLSHDSLPTDLAVGAHTVHLQGAAFSDGVLCQSCHRVPLAIADGGHFGEDSIAEINFAGLSGAQGAWTRSTATCAGTYCHGNFTGGDPTNSPNWTAPGSVACGSCHDAGANPAQLGWKHQFHVAEGGLKCAECHYSVVDMAGEISGLALHVNGVVDTMIRDTLLCQICHQSGGAGVCTGCHGGTDNQTGAPPKGLRGETTTGQRAVGAHTVHLAGNSISNGFACTECHVRPFSIISTGHLGADSIAEMTWGPITGSATSWSRTTNQCSNSYCHGNFAGGKITNAPLWTGTNQAACGTCHDVGSNPSQLGGRHSKHVSGEGIACYRCHNATVNSSNAIVGKAVHINRQNTVQFSSGGTYSSGTCSSIGCHGSESWF